MFLVYLASQVAYILVLLFSIGLIRIKYRSSLFWSLRLACLWSWLLIFL